MNTETHITELLPAYALHCLDPEEAAQVEAHLAVCADCRLELRAYEGTVADLALTLPEATPPPGLKDRLLAEMAAESSQTAVAPPPSAAPSIWQQIRLFFARPVWQFTALALIVVLLVGNVVLWQQLNQAETVVSFGTVNLTGTAAAPDASGVVIISADGKHGTLVVQTLPGLDETHEYQLWLSRDGRLTAGRSFTVDEDGYRTLWVGAPEPLGNYTGFSVTIEPAGGSLYPTGQEVLADEP